MANGLIKKATFLFSQVIKKIKQLPVKIEYYANFTEDSSLKILLTVSTACFIEGSCSIFTRYGQNNYRKLSRVESSASNLREKNELTRQNSPSAYGVHHSEYINSNSDELVSYGSVASRRLEESRFNYLREARLAGLIFNIVDAIDVSTTDDYLLEKLHLNPNNSAIGFSAASPFFSMESSYRADIQKQIEEFLKFDISHDTLDVWNIYMPALLAIRLRGVPSLYLNNADAQQLQQLQVKLSSDFAELDISQDTLDVRNIYMPALLNIRLLGVPSLYLNNADAQQLQHLRDKLRSDIAELDISQHTLDVRNIYMPSLLEIRLLGVSSLYLSKADVQQLQQFQDKLSSVVCQKTRTGSRSAFTSTKTYGLLKIINELTVTKFWKVNTKYLSDNTVAGYTHASRKSAAVGTTPCSEIPKNSVLELNVGSSEKVSGIIYGKQLETGENDRKLNRQIDDDLTYLNRHAVGPDEFQLIKPVCALSLYERKQVSLEELKGLGSESRLIFLVRETEVYTKEETRLDREPQYQLAVVTAEGFEDAWRQSLVQEYSLEHSNYFPRDSKMIVYIPVYRQGFINRSDRKRQKD